MPVWEWFFIAALVAVAGLAVAIAFGATRRRKTKKLKERFGPEYEKTVSEVGEERAAEKELTARERARSKLDISDLTPEAQERYAASWRSVQAAFVDHPADSVRDADRLVSEVMRERGYPVDEFERRVADISVDHPDVVENYRSAHQIYEAQGDGDAGTEEQRTAFVHYRALFEKLLGPDDDRPADDARPAGDRRADDGQADDPKSAPREAHA